MSTPTAQAQVVVEREIAAPLEHVFDAWLDAETLATFMTPGEGVQVTRVEVHAREGGRFLIVMSVGDHELHHRGTYRLIHRPHHLEFNWISANAGPESVVRLDFTDLDDGTTRIRLAQFGLPSADSIVEHDRGWSTILDTLLAAFASLGTDRERSTNHRRRPSRKVDKYRRG